MTDNNLPDNVYYDVQIHNSLESSDQSRRAEFQETRNTPIIKNSSLYDLSIVRFQLDTYSLPSWIPSIKTNQNISINEMNDIITLEYGEHVVPQNLTWVPTNVHVKPPTLPVGNSIDFSDEYYHANSFRHYCDLINTALASASNVLKLLDASLNDMIPPYCVWNEINNTMEIYAQELFFNQENNNHVKIFFNRALYSNFTSIPAKKNFNKGDRAYEIIIKSDVNTKSVLLDINNTDVLFIKTPQEYSTISNWSPVSAIVFTSNTLPIIQTQMSEAIIFRNGEKINANIPQNFSPIISDMATNEMVYKPNLYYIPSAEYRKISMVSNNPINTIDIQIYWKSVTGQLIPFLLQSGASCSIKFLFTKKHNK